MYPSTLRGDTIEDKNKVGLLFTATGVGAGLLSAVVTEVLFQDMRFINFAVYALALLILYLTVFLIPHLGVDTEKQGKVWKIVLSNAFSFIIAWAVVWALIYELNRY